MKISAVILLLVVVSLGVIDYASAPDRSPLTQLGLVSIAYADRDRGRDRDRVEVDDVARRSSRRGDRRDRRD